jgi:hypothetical protein
VGGGGQAGHVRDQWKRKTILTAENHFPYVKKRIPVRHKQEVRCPSQLPRAPAPHFPSSSQHSSMFPPKLTCVCACVRACVRVRASVSDERVHLGMDAQTCLSPIANAVETIEGRAAAITAELQAEPNPNPNSLQGLLQGALLLRTFPPPFVHRWLYKGRC